MGQLEPLAGLISQNHDSATVACEDWHSVVDTTLLIWLYFCSGHTMEEGLLTKKIIGSKTRDDNSTLYKIHFQQPYLLVK